jgi:hypothetical protein
VTTGDIIAGMSRRRFPSACSSGAAVAAGVLLLVAFHPARSAPPSGHAPRGAAVWRDAEDVVDGWDWSLPPGVVPADRSGVSFEGRAPAGFPGKRLARLRWTWAQLEPGEGEYDFEPLRREIERAGRRHDGVVLLIHGATASTEIADRGRTRVREGTAPSWLAERYGVPELPVRTKTNLATPFTVHNLDPAHPELHRRYLAMLGALGESGIPEMPEIAFVVVPGVSASRGEEAGLAARDELTVACMTERLEAWARAFRGREWKLAWVGDGTGGSPLLARAYALGMGQRCGKAERYLLHLAAPELGQSLDDRGYLLVDESCAPIAEGRAFGDENEEYAPDVHVERFGPMESWPHRYRESMLRALQMRRNWLWVESDPWVDPPLLGWVSLELGRTVDDAPDAWCELRESRVHVGGRERSVKNFERWLLQRDRPGAQTVAVRPAEYAGAPDVEEWTARRTDVASGNDTIGFALDDRFLSGGPHRVAVKVTYVDAEDAVWELVVPAAGGGELARTVTTAATGIVRTATFFLDDAAFPARGEELDFRVRALEGDAVLCFVRVIRR